jgi:kynurenine formamidase
MPATNHPDLAQTALFEQRGFAAIGADTIAVQSGSGRWEVLAEWFTAEDFRGSLITNAAVELRARPEHPAHQVVATHRAWVQQLLEQLAAAGGPVDPPTAAEQIHLLVEGAIVRAVSGQRATAAASGRALTAALLAAGGEWAWE